MLKMIASLVTFAAGLAVASPAMAQCQKIVNYNSNQCMAVAGGTMQSGQPVIQWDCTGTPDQYWSFYSDGSQTQITNCKDTSYCLSFDDNEGSELTISPCAWSKQHTRANILWYQSWFTLPFDQGGDNAWVLANDVGFVAAVSLGGGPGAGTTEGTGIIQWVDQISGPFDHEEQQWIFE